MNAAVSALEGSAPVVKVWTEQGKYEAMWDKPEYRMVAPGESAAHLFLEIARPKEGAEVIDFGAGTGRGALMLALMGSMKVRMVDFAANCLDEDLRNALETQKHVLDFTQHDLINPLPFSAEFGFCTDVLEHIPPCHVDIVLKHILQSAQHVFLQISCEDDVCGKLIGLPLHLSVHDHAWWLKKLQEFEVAVHWSQDFGSHCCFYVTAWQTGDDIVKVGELNVSETEVIANVRANVDAGWQEIVPHPTNDIDVMILGGGPSMNDHVETIKQLRREGVKLITLNGAYNWALERGLEPSAQVMVDAREFNNRFTKPVHPTCKYLISSQCHPSIFEGLPKERTYLWHTGAECTREALSERGKDVYFVPGGNTVLLRAIPLLRMLGFKRFHLFGCDSCITDAGHHAYAQPENDGAMVVDTIVGGRVFKCHPWMIAQGREFISLIEALGEEIELEIYGDGLLKQILTTGAQLAEDAEFLT